jgi:hypothetical protein
MLRSTGLPKVSFSTSCFTGEYPVDLKERYEEFNYPSGVVTEEVKINSAT